MPGRADIFDAPPVRTPTAQENLIAQLSPDVQARIASGELVPNFTQSRDAGITGISGLTRKVGDHEFENYDTSGAFAGMSNDSGGFLGQVTQAANVLPSLAMAAGINFVTSGAASAIGGQLLNAGLVTSTAAANATGAALINAGVSVAQGTPADQALKNAAISVLASQVVSPEVATEVKSVISDPTIANTVTNMGTSIVKGLATGQSLDQIGKLVVGSFVNSALNPTSGTGTPGTKTADASDAVQNDFNNLVASGVDSDTALSTVMDWHASGDTQQVADNAPVDDSLLPTNNEAVASGTSPGSLGAQEAAAGNLSQDELAAAYGVDTTSGLDVLAPPPVSPNQAVASGTGPGSLGAQEAVAGNLSPSQLDAAYGVDASGLDVLNNQNARTAGSAPGSVEAATRLTDPMDLLAAGAGDSGSLPTALGNEAVASGTSPGSLGAQAAADNSLLDSQQSAAYGTSNVADLTGGTAAANNLTRSPNEAVASGTSPGSAGAAQAAAGTLTADQLAAASGTNNPVSALPTTPRAPAAPTVVGALPTTGASPTTSYSDQAAVPGKLLTVGKMGNGSSERQLKQLYDTMTPSAPSVYDYDDTTDPVSVNVAQMNYQPYAAQPMYAHGGLVHLAEGGPADSSTSDVMAALKGLGSLGFDGKVARPQLLQQGQMGAPYNPKVLPQLAAVLRARGVTLAEGGQPNDHEHPEYDGTPVFRTGGLEGLGGKYVEGKGDGTSDDITAMLANGEYVFSADVVAALGNGSNKAGAEKLNEMVQAIRSRARSAPPDKLPPDAKSPLEYLKSSKGKKNA